MLGPRHKMILSGQRRDFDSLKPCSRLVVRPAKEVEIPTLVNMCAAEISMLTAFEDATRRVHRHNRRAVLAVVDRSENPIGTIAPLPLNGRGLDALLSGEFPFADPELRLLCREWEAPAGIYVWAICATGRAAAGIGNIMAWLKRDGWQHANMYGKPSTPDGARLMKHGGFLPFRSGQEGLWRYRRRAFEPTAAAAA